MERALVLGLSLFMACWFIHLVIWRIHRPQAYPIWLPFIFLLIPLVAAIFYEIWPVPKPQANPIDIIAGGLLHIVLSCSYICGYAGIIEYSPSAEILLVVHSCMPEGVREGSLTIDSLTEYALTGKRIDDLFASGLVKLENHQYVLTQSGVVVANFSRQYRRFLGVSSMGEG